MRGGRAVNYASATHDDKAHTQRRYVLLEDDGKTIKEAMLTPATATRYNRQLAGSGYRWRVK